MRSMQFLIFAGIFSLYIGFSAVQGYFLRSTRGPSYRSAGWSFVGAYALLIWIPTSAFIAMLDWMAVFLRLLTLISGIATIAIVAWQPEWIPDRVWSRAFNRRYLGATMALVALSALIPWLPKPNIAALALGLAACLAGFSALRDITARA
ncbi:MAG: hypothetical protein PVI04_00505 [Anaerolineales bacterium]